MFSECRILNSGSIVFSIYVLIRFYLVYVHLYIQRHFIYTRLLFFVIIIHYLLKVTTITGGKMHEN